MDNTYFSESKKQMNYFKSFGVFATTFYTIDPIVLLLQTSARFNVEKKFEDTRLKSGDVFSVSPIVYFAVNPFVSLNAGVRYQYQTKDKLNGATNGYAGSSLGYTFGLAWEMSANRILYASAQKLETAQYSSDSF